MEEIFTRKLEKIQEYFRFLISLIKLFNIILGDIIPLSPSFYYIYPIAMYPPKSPNIRVYIYTLYIRHTYICIIMDTSLLSGRTIEVYFSS